jgi:hypothetical protein
MLTTTTMMMMMIMMMLISKVQGKKGHKVQAGCDVPTSEVRA